MANHEPEEFWYHGKVTRRRWLGLSAAAAGAVGASLLVPPPWRSAFGQAKPYKIGTLQPLSGAAAAGGKTALVGSQMAVDRINKAGGVNGRPIELIVADYESKPDVGRRKAEKLVVEDKIDLHQGGFLSNVCIACMPVWEEHKILNMIGVCLDTTITTSKCSRYTFRPFDYAPAQAVAFAPYLVNKLGKKWHLAYADYRRQGDRLVIPYVYAAPPLRGGGAAGRLMEGVLAVARREGRKVTPLCGYAAAYIRRHRQHHDLLD